MTVAQNVAFGLEERQLPRAEIARKTAAALELVGLRILASAVPVSSRAASSSASPSRARLRSNPSSCCSTSRFQPGRATARAYAHGAARAAAQARHHDDIRHPRSGRSAVDLRPRRRARSGVIQQVGTPMELFDRPVNRFIAEFRRHDQPARRNRTCRRRRCPFDSPLLGNVEPCQRPSSLRQRVIAFRPHTLTLAWRIAPAPRIASGLTAHRPPRISRRVRALPDRCARH